MLFSGVLVNGLVTRDEESPKYSNGTHVFAPTVIFISLDGVVNHDLDLYITPELTGIGKYKNNHAIYNTITMYYS